MTPFELGWVIGLIEGEGCFVKSEDKRRPGTFTVKIQVEMTDKDVIDKLNKLIPGNVVLCNYPSRRKKFPDAKDSWRWTISTKQQVKELGEQLLPHLSARRQERLKEVLEKCVYLKGPNKNDKTIRSNP